MENQTFISCVAWIHRGYAAKVPIQAQIPAQQIQQMKQDPMVHQQLMKQKQYQMSQDMQEEQQGMPVFSQSLVNGGMGNNNGYPQLVDDLQDDEKQDYYIKDSDILIVSGKIQKEYSSLQVYVYQKQNNNLFVHHQIMLSSFPLALQWLNVDLGTIGNDNNNHNKGNYAIVSTFLPQIQIWNLDLAQAVQPDMILGGQLNTNKKKVKKFTNKAKKYKQGSHTDSVLSLSLNASHKNILASGSADNTVKIWDLAQGKNIHTCTHHNSKVNKVKWSPIDKTVIFTASQDKTIAILDSRYPNDLISHKLHNKQSSIQAACWNTNQPTQICYTTDTGMLNIIDVRNIDKLLVSFAAHQGKSITDVKIGSKNLCYTCSEDQSVRIWNLNSLQAPLAYKKPKCGKMYCIDVLEDQQGPVLTVGNGKGDLFVWDITENQHVNNYWKSN